MINGVFVIVAWTGRLSSHREPPLSLIEAVCFWREDNRGRFCKAGKNKEEWVGKRFEQRTLVFILKENLENFKESEM